METHEIVDRLARLLLVRHPVDRFRSARAQTRCPDMETFVRRSLDDVASMAPGRLPQLAGMCNLHFHPQCRYASEGTRLFRYPDHLDALLAAAGLDELPRENTSKDRPELLEADEAWVLDAYERDMRLYDSVAEPGMPADGSLMLLDFVPRVWV